MKQNFDQCFGWLLEHEGGYTNDPRDPGGMTNLGVTHIDWAAWAHHEPSEDEMRALTPDDVAPLYRAKYWQAMSCDDLPSGVDWAVMDFGVNSGVSRAAKYLQRVLDISQDGHIGLITTAACATRDASDIIDALCDARQAFLEALPTFDHFGRGWTTRVNKVRQQAKDLVA